MKNFQVVLAILLAPVFVWAQTDSLLTTTTGKLTEQKQSEKLKAKHANWNSCFIVMMNGDTLKGKVKKREDYSFSRGLFTEGKVLFAHVNDREEIIQAKAFRELCLAQMDSEYMKYITLAKDTGESGRKIYRVVADGKCKLLFDEIPASLGVPILTPPEERYYIYYNSKLTRMRREAEFNLNAGFKKRYKEIFSECPGLLAKIEDKTYKPDDLRGIVTAFNRCIAITGGK